MERLFLVSQGRQLVDRRLSRAGREGDFAHALAAALGEARRGPTRTVSTEHAVSVRNRVERAAMGGLDRVGAMEDTMLSPDRIRRLHAPHDARPTDYDLVRRAIAYISEHWRAQPEIEAIASAAGVTSNELHHLFRRWAGLTPKGFLQALTLDHARATAARFRERARCLLRGGPVGPGTAARSVRHPRGDVAGRMEGRRRRADDPLRLPPVAIRHRAGDGDAARACGPRLRGSRAKSGRARRHVQALAEGAICRGPGRTAPLARRIFDPTLWRADQPLRVVLIGTDFEVRVWETLLRIPMGRAHHLFGHRRARSDAEGGARRRRRGRQESAVVRGAVPPRARQERRPHRLSLGRNPQARDDRLGGRRRGGVRFSAARCSERRRSGPWSRR